ncbi:MAG: hypothetical protein DIU80_005845 [Chloroflexota bacterium]|mgnify:CR=1 FL=1|nr:MAG: hypothetical protein DIU80_02695 [Chloroflexota bacterium]
MESAGTNWTLLLVQLLNIALLAAWVALAVVALRRLRRRQLPPMATAIWAALIVLVPLLGAAALLLVYPAADRAIPRGREDTPV